MGASGWDYIESYDGDVEAALGRVRQREFERLFAEDGCFADLRPAGAPYTSVDAIDPLWEEEEFGSEGTHTIVDVWEVVGSEDYDDDHTVRPLTDEEAAEIFGTAQPTRADFERVRRAVPSSRDLWDMPRWSAWCVPLRETADAAAAGAGTSGASATPEIAFWGISGD